MASPNTQLRNWLDHLHTLRRELDSYDARVEEWTQPGSAERSRVGVKQMLGFQLGAFLHACVEDPITDPSTAEGVVGYTHFLRVTLLTAENANMEQAIASLHELNDKMTDVANRWLKSGVNEVELKELVAEMQVEVEKVKALGGSPDVPKLS